MIVGRRRCAAALAAVFVALVCASSAAAAPLIHAHRGGSVLNGVPSFPEDTMPAFENAAREQVVLELDVKLTKDLVPVVIHDDTPDRTTDCDAGTPAAPTAANRVADYTAVQLARCRADVLGSPGAAGGLPTKKVDRPSVPVPTLAEVLALARRTGARVNLEIKNLPNDNDFDPTPGYANRVMDLVIASGLPTRQLIIQSFIPDNLDVAKARLPAVETSFLTLQQLNDFGPEFAASRGYEYVSPAFPVSAAYVAKAHSLGRRVVPFTLNSAAELRAAAALGVDEVITDDPGLARRTFAGLGPAPSAIPPAPSAAECRSALAERSLPPLENYDARPGAPRVFAMQFKQEARSVVTYEAFRRKIECMIIEYVKPRLATGRPNVVAFTEDVGLLTIATGSRGAVARNGFAGPGRAAECESAGSPPACAAAALAAIESGYAKEAAGYRTRFPSLAPVFPGAFVSTTDTFARGWMQTFSDMARRYGIYISGSNNQAPFRESTDPAEIELFRDPDLPRPVSVFVATAPQVYNEVFMWGPSDVRPDGPLPLRNVVSTNRKVPLTSTEDLLRLTPGASSGPDGIANVAPYSLPGTKARIAFATSLPAFVYGALPAGTDPCSDTARFYMRCLDRLGTNLVIQDEANPGAWVDFTAPDSVDRGAWQALSFMSSTWRAVTDAGVDFDYNVVPHMVGNLADLPFDGQSVITQRGLTGGSGCNYVGVSRSFPEDPERFDIGGESQLVRPYTGPKTEFLAMAPWVTPDAPRPELQATGRKLAPGSGDPLENDYLETALVADLPFPPRAGRASCVTATSQSAPARIRLTVSPATTRAGRRTRFSFSATALVAGERRAVRRATVTFAGVRARTGSNGSVTIVRRPREPGTLIARVTAAGLRAGSTAVRVRAAQRRERPGGRDPRFTG